MLGFLFLAACAVVVVMVIVLIRKIGQSRHLVRISATKAVRAEARAEAIDGAATRLVDATKQSVRQVGEALEVAKVIHEVNGKMDVLLEHAAIDQTASSNRGKHVRTELHAVPSDQEGRFIA